jgi:hypothetical protein
MNIISQNDDSILLVYDSKLTITVFAAYMAVILASIYYLLRVGFPDPIIPIIKTLSISLYFICFPSFYRLIRMSFSGCRDKSTLTTDAFISLGNLLIITLVAYFAPLLPFDILPWLGTLGIIIFFILFIFWLRKGSWKHSIAFLMISAILSILMAAHIWSSAYVSPLYVENIVLDTAHVDTLYHAAIAGMIKTYGIPSTGLDGIPFRAYHCGSHWLFAQLSKLLNLRVIDFYQLGYPVIFIPWLLQCMLGFALDLKNIYYKQMMPVIDLRKDLLFWLVFFFFLLESSPVSELAMRYGIHTTSQSYIVSLLFVFLFLSIGLDLIYNRENQGGYFWQIITFIIIIPGLVSFAGFAKVSLGYLLLCIYLYVFYRIKCYKKILPIISLIITLILTMIVIMIVDSGQLGLKIAPFNFIINSKLHIFIILLHYFLSWLFIAYRLYETHSVTIKELVDNIKAKQMLDVEVIALLCLTSLAPFLIFQERGGGEYYFTDVQNIVVMSFLLANWTNIEGLIKEWITQFKSLSKVKIKDIVVAFFLLAFAVESIFMYINPLKILIKSNLSTRLAYYYMSTGYNPENQKDFTGKFRSYLELRGLPINYRFNSKSMIKVIHAVKDDLIFMKNNKINDERVKLIHNIYDMGMMRTAEKRKTAIFIPPSNRIFWELSSDIKKPPFIVPALSEIALIKGLPPSLSAQEIKAMGYGFRGYKLPPKGQARGDSRRLFLRDFHN